MKKYILYGIGIIFIVLVASVIYFRLEDNTVQAPTQPTDTSSTEKTIVTSYITENIKTIATNAPVLGGSWYVVSLEVNTTANTAQAVYEDGHIQSSADIEYSFNQFSGEVAIEKFTITE